MSSIYGFFVYMIRLFSILFIALSLCQKVSAQYLFQRVYGGNGYDSGCEVIEASDGGYYVAGSSGSFDEGMSSQVLLMKTDSHGYVEWQKTYGEQFADQATTMQLSSDGNIFIGGYAETIENGYQMQVMKVNLTGDVLWSNQFGGSEWDFCRELVALSDGGCAAFGQTYSFGNGEGDFYLVRLDASGDTLWTRTYGGTELESGESISLTLEGGFYLSGHSESFGAGKKDIYLLKTDASGNVIWSNTYGWAEDEFVFGSCTASDGGVVVVGGTFSNTPDEGDFMMYKISAVGDSVRARLEDGSADEYWMDVIEDESGNFITVGYVEDSGFGKEDIRVQRVTPALNFGGMAASRGTMENDRGFDIKKTSDNAYILAGVTEGYLNRFDDILLMKMDLEGETVDPELAVDEINLGEEAFEVTFGPNPMVGESVNLLISDFQRLQRQVEGKLGFELFSALGQRVYSTSILSGVQSLDVSKVESGIYFYQLTAENRILATGKLIKSN